MTRLTLSRKQRIKSRKLIASIFERGRKIRSGPLLLFYLRVDSAIASHVRMFGVTVSRRSFKRAVDRNRIKRLVREAYRIEQNAFLTIQQDDSYALFVVYVGREIQSFENIKSAINRLAQNWASKVAEKN